LRDFASSLDLPGFQRDWPPQGLQDIQTGERMMFIRNALMCMAIALGPVAIPTAAGAAVVIEIGVPPPAPRYERIPAPRAGYVWASGYWRWQGEHHVWTNGRWKRERPGSHWVAERWDERGGRQHFEPGRWEHDEVHGERDHDRDKHH
jgi:hypothetical protein